MPRGNWRSEKADQRRRGVCRRNDRRIQRVRYPSSRHDGARGAVIDAAVTDAQGVNARSVGKVVIRYEDAQSPEAQRGRQIMQDAKPRY
jgi:hypothetical protein